MNRAYMHFDLDAGFVNVVRKGLSEFTINGRRIRVDDASPQKEKLATRENKVFDKFEKKGPKAKKKW